MKTEAERQRALRERRIEEGLTRKEYWATGPEHDQLKHALRTLREAKGEAP